MKIREFTCLSFFLKLIQDLGSPPVLVSNPTGQQSSQRGLAPEAKPKKSRVRSLDAFRG